MNTMSRIKVKNFIGSLLAVAVAAGCVTSATSEASPGPAPEDIEPMVEEVIEPPTAIVNAESNVREGPGTNFPANFWLSTGTVVTVTGRNADGSWLQIEHEGRTGWIFRPLTDIEPSVSAGLPEVEPESDPAGPGRGSSEGAASAPDNSGSVGAPAEQPTPEPEPEPEPGPPPPKYAVVTGTVVNLRLGPGTHHGIDGQVVSGDRLNLAGRNADGSWLRVMHPVATGELVWIFADLTDIDADAALALAVVVPMATQAVSGQSEVVLVIETPSTPAPAAPPSRAPTVPAGCARLHTINPNETQLSQIADWFGLDIHVVADLNQLETTDPLTAGWQICLPEASEVLPKTAPQPQPVPAPQPAASGQCLTPIGPQPCIKVPDFPERGYPHAAVGEIVVDTGLDILWHAPGTYDRDLPGLTYDFELVFSDNSVMWDWHIRDFEGCYDALRVHMGLVPEEFGLQRMELRLADSFISEEGDVNWKEFHWRENDIYFSPQAAVAVPWLEPMSNWDPAALPHPDAAVVQYGCYLQPNELAVCDIVPWWGNSHSIHLNAAAARAMANTVMYMSNDALANRYRSRLHERVLQADAYLFPQLDNRRGDPAGHGPCADLWHAG